MKPTAEWWTVGRIEGSNRRISSLQGAGCGTEHRRFKEFSLDGGTPFEVVTIALAPNMWPLNGEKSQKIDWEDQMLGTWLTIKKDWTLGTKDTIYPKSNVYAGPWSWNFNASRLS